jgi:5,10-methenyltetrahydromethanopterin hydrogenase
MPIIKSILRIKGTDNAKPPEVAILYLYSPLDVGSAVTIDDFISKRQISMVAKKVKIYTIY